MLGAINQSLSHIKVETLQFEKLFDLERYVSHYFVSEMIRQKSLVPEWNFKFVKFNQINESALTLLKNFTRFCH